MELSEEKKRNLYLRKIAKGEIFGPMTGYPSKDKPWLKYFSEDVIMSDIPQKTAYEMLVDSCKKWPNKIAIEFFSNKITYNDLLQKVDKMADYLASYEIKKGDVFTSCLPNIPEAIYLIYAASKIGAIIDLIDPFTSQEIMKKYCTKTKSKLLFTIDVCFQNVEDLTNTTDVEKIVVLSPVESLPLLNIIYKLKSKKINYDEKILSWAQFKDINNILKAEKVAYEKDLPFAILHTGGTTGIPKGALLSNDNVTSLAYQFINSDLDMKPGESALNLMPPFASYGLGNGTHVHLCAGLRLILIPTYEPYKIESQILKYKPNRIACSPAHYEYIDNGEKIAKAKLDFLHHPIVGGDTLKPEREESINKLLAQNGCPDKIAKGYGMTETCSGVCVCINNEVNKLASVGVPLYHNVISSFDLNDPLKENPYGVDGEICILSPNNMLGYYKDDEETAKVFLQHLDGSVWLHTGDLGHIDEDGNVFIKGRLKRMIIQYSGLKSSPFEAEDVIIKHPKVINAVVVGVDDPDHDQGELPVAYVQINEEDMDNVETIREEIYRECSLHVTYYSLPVDFIFVTEYPRTAIAKIDYKKLSEDYNQNMKSHRLIRQREMKF